MLYTIHDDRVPKFEILYSFCMLFQLSIDDTYIYYCIVVGTGSLVWCAFS